MKSAKLDRVERAQVASLLEGAQKIRATLANSNSVTLTLFVPGANASEVPQVELSARVLGFFADCLELAAKQKPLQVTQKKELMTSEEVAQALGFSRPFINQEIKRGRLVCIFAGRQRRISAEEVERYRRTYTTKLFSGDISGET